MTERKTVVYPNPQVLAEAVAARTLLTIIDLLAEPNRKRVDIAVTGGTDGNRVFAAMNASPLNDAVDWSRVHVWWGDERFVAADDDDRNAKQAREAWYDYEPRGHPVLCPVLAARGCAAPGGLAFSLCHVS